MIITTKTNITSSDICKYIIRNLKQFESYEESILEYGFYRKEFSIIDNTYYDIDNIIETMLYVVKRANEFKRITSVHVDYEIENAIICGNKLTIRIGYGRLHSVLAGTTKPLKPGLKLNEII